MAMKKVDMIIIVPPAGFKNSVYPPYGAMYIASALRKSGYNPAILNVDTERISNAEVIERVRELDPDNIGLSGIVAPSYRYLKELSLELKRAFPGKVQIMGGGLSSAADPVLKNTAVDIVVRGEGDATIIELMDCLARKGDIKSVRGIHIRESDRCLFTGNRGLIGKLDDLPYPAFDLIDMDRYLPDGIEFMRKFTKDIDGDFAAGAGRGRRMITIPTSRGCFGECSFCFRAYPGIRVNSMKYVFDFIEYCIEKYDVGYFTFGDECFAPSRARNWEFIEEYKKRKMNFVFRILGMRVDTVDKDVLKAYRDINCWMIEYGFESGSQKMLNVINKRATVEQNRNAALWTHEAGIYTSPALVLGMPGETEETIGETIEFLKSLRFNYKQYQWKYALPIPGSALYDFAKLAGAIEDEDEYLSSLTGRIENGGVFHINLTDQPDDAVGRWDGKLRRELDNYYLEMTYRNIFLGKIARFLKTLDMHIRRRSLGKAIVRRMERRPRDRETGPRFRKRPGVSIEALLKGIDCSVPNKEASLKSINKRMNEEVTAGR